MSTSLAVRSALRALVAAACPAAEVRGFVEDATEPEEIPDGGMVIGYAGDPGEPEVDLSPLAYTYWHRIPVEVTVPAETVPAGTVASDDVRLDALLVPIGTAVGANRSLGGLVTFLDLTAAEITSADMPGSAPARTARFEFIAEYTVSNPLAG